MVDSFSEISHEGYFSRIGGSIKGIFGGIVLFFVGFPVLFLNEGCAVKRYQDLAAGRKAIVEVSAERVGEANDSKLVYLTGAATSGETLRDEAFAVEINSIQLKRTAEIYQWRENEETKKDKQFGGGEKKVTTYDYEKIWSESLIDSESFHEKGREAHKNPQSMPVTSSVTSAKAVTLGAFTLSPDLVRQVTAYQDMPLTDAMVNAASDKFSLRKVSRADGWIYIGSDSAQSAPEIGDIRVKFSSVSTPQTVSIIAAQQDNSFAAWKSPSGRMLEQTLRLGTVTPDEIFSAKESERATLTWIVRGVGFFMMFGGVTMILKPLSVLADVIPLLGSIVGVGTGIVAFLIAAPAAFLTIAAAWLFYRPLIGIPLVILAIAAIVGLVVLLRRQRGQQAVVDGI